MNEKIGVRDASAAPMRGGVIPSRKTYLASLQTSRRQGICLNLALMKKAGRQAGSIAVSSHPCERTMASRSFFVASLTLRIASASSGVIASVIYLNVADLTSSSCGHQLRDHNTAQS